MSQDIFPILNDFVVHEMYSCSPHVPIQINLKVKYKQPDTPDDSFCINKLIWDDNKVDEFRQQINSEIVTFENISGKYFRTGLFSPKRILTKG